MRSDAAMSTSGLDDGRFARYSPWSAESGFYGKSRRVSRWIKNARYTVGENIALTLITVARFIDHTDTV
jgi:hypothetical protein